MKRIVICCDGTWNRLDAKHRTNVARLSEAILADGGEREMTAQVVYHLDGVGSGRGTGELARAADRLLGGAFGWGLDALIMEAYRFLVLNYAPGDQIYLFGFSRGAYCARSLCGLIRRAGIVERQNAAAIPKARKLYRDPSPDAAADKPKALEFRARYSSHITTVPDELAWRRARAVGENPDPTPLRLAYLGVWDTVGSLGVPQGLIASVARALGIGNGHLFHDTHLSPLLDSARHAVALDERRRDFEPTLWSLEETRQANRSAYQQKWFPGVHGAVGGGSPDKKLAYCALHWIVKGAREAGLNVDTGMADRWRTEGRFNGPLTGNVNQRGLLARIFGLRSRDRNAVIDFEDVSDVAKRRWIYSNYRSRLLKEVEAQMGTWTDPEPRPTWLSSDKPSDGEKPGGEQDDEGLVPAE